MGKNQRQRAAQKSRERQLMFEPPGAATGSSVGRATAALGGLSLTGSSAEEEEEQLQLALALSLSAEEARAPEPPAEEAPNALLAELHAERAARTAAPAAADAAPTAADAPPPEHFSRLPTELLSALCARLSWETIGSLACACSSLRTLMRGWLADEPRSLVLGKWVSWFMSPLQLEQRPGPQRLTGARWADGRKVISLLRAMPQLESLAVAGADANGFLAGLQDPLAFDRPEASDRVRRLLEEILLLPVATSLRTLKLAKVFTKSFLDGRQVAGLLSADFLAALPARCPRLTSLDLDSCPELNDGLALALAPLPLRKLRLSGNPQLTEGALQALLKRSSDALRIVDFSECANSRLAIHDEYAVTPIAPSGWEPLRGLEELSLRAWTTPLRTLNLTAAEPAAALTFLDVTTSDQLGIVKLALPALRHFVANSCPLLTYVTLDGCPTLEKVHLNLCSSLTKLSAADSHAIESLMLFGCRIIGEGYVRPLLQNNATMLELNLNGALNTVNIEEAEIRKLCPNLRYLDARGRARKY